MASPDAPPPRVAIVPGNGCTDVEQSNWYGWLAAQLRADGVEVAIRDMPDPFVARKDVWLPFMRDELGCADGRTVVVGHSSGAVAAMRYLEQGRLRGAVIVSACVTDLGDANERASGYYSDPWDFAAQRANADWLVQFGSASDPFIPIEEQREVAAGLGLAEGAGPVDGAAEAFYNLPRRGHFMDEEMPEVLEVLRALFSVDRDV